jgi:hypothetical protein
MQSVIRPVLKMVTFPGLIRMDCSGEESVKVIIKIKTSESELTFLIIKHN